MRCWINVISREHVERGVEGGFTQADHGKPTRLRRLGAGDPIVFYSPRTAMRSGEPLQEFTALGRVGERLYQVEMSPDFHPWRREVDFTPVSSVPVRDLRDQLSFLPEGRAWGMVFRRGLFEIPAGDFGILARAMGANEP